MFPSPRKSAHRSPWVAPGQAAGLRRRPLIASLAVVLVAGLLGACAAGGPTGLEPAPEVNVATAYQLAPGDKVRINVYGHPDISGEFDVDGTGAVTFPLLGQVQAAGRTVAALKETVADRLDEDYIVDPRVSVEVLTYRPFYVLGQVERPGSYPYQPGMTVRQAIALAGGYTRRASTSSMLLIRPAEEGTKEYAAAESTTILPGDTIEVQRRLF